MNYKENPPKLSKDKEFIDEMVNLYINALCDRERLLEVVIMTEYLNPSKDTRDTLEEAYTLLNETDTNLGQLEITFKTRIEY